MKSIFILLLLLLGIGLFTRAYNIRTRLIMVAAIAAMILVVTLI